MALIITDTDRELINELQQFEKQGARKLNDLSSYTLADLKERYQGFINPFFLQNSKHDEKDIKIRDLLEFVKKYRAVRVLAREVETQGKQQKFLDVSNEVLSEARLPDILAASWHEFGSRFNDVERDLPEIANNPVNQQEKASMLISALRKTYLRTNEIVEQLKKHFNIESTLC